MTTVEVTAELVRRRLHVRQMLGYGVFEVWVDDRKHSTHRAPIDAELAVRKILGITNEDGIEVLRELERRMGVS